MTRPLVLSIALLAAVTAVLWMFLRTPAGEGPVRSSPLAPASPVGTTAGIDSATSVEERSTGRVDITPSAKELPSAPAAATPVAGTRGAPVDDARFLSTIDALFERSFRGPVDQQDAIRLLDSALAGLDPASGREQ